MDITSAAIAALNTGFKTAYNNAFAGVTPTWNKVAMPVPSTTAGETYGWLGQFPNFREWIGDRVHQNLGTHDFYLKNKKFELTVTILRDAIEDDQYGVYSPMMASMGDAAASHPDSLVFQLLPAGFTTACYDGQYFFDTDHPVLDANGAEQSVSNNMGGAGTPWYLIDGSRPIKPFIFQKRRDYEFKAKTAPLDDNVFDRDEYVYGVDARVNAGFGLWQLAVASKQTLDKAGYAAARQAMLDMKGDYGRPLNLRPNLLVVPPSLEGKARDILLAERDAAGATNTYRNTADLFVCPWL